MSVLSFFVHLYGLSDKQTVSRNLSKFQTVGTVIKLCETLKKTTQNIQRRYR